MKKMKRDEIRPEEQGDVIVGRKIYKYPFVAVEQTTVTAEDVKKPEINRPKPDYLKDYRMSDDELKGYIQNTIDYYTMRAECGIYTMNVSDLIMMELVRRELERRKKEADDA